MWARLPDPPSQDELKAAFRQAYQQSLTASPCFGGADGVSGRNWWRATIRRVLDLCGRTYSDAEFGAKLGLDPTPAPASLHATVLACR